MIASAKQMSSREALIRKLEKQAAHDAVHFSPPFQLASGFAESDSTSGGDYTIVPHDWQLAAIPVADMKKSPAVAATKQTPTAKPKPRVLLRRPKPAPKEVASQSTPVADVGSDASPEQPTSDSLNPITRLQELVTRAKYGDSEAVESIRRELDSNPTLWQAVGDLAAHAETLLISVIADGNELVTLSMEREIERLKLELAEGVAPTPLERLAIQRIVAAWLHGQYVDRATLVADAKGAKIAAWGRRQEAAQRRFHAAISSLALVRRMAPKQTLAKSTAPVPNRQSNQLKGQESVTPNGLREELSGPNKLGKRPIANGSDVLSAPPSNRIRSLIRPEAAVT